MELALAQLDAGGGAVLAARLDHGGWSANIVGSLTANSVTVTTPAHAAGAVDVVVSTFGGTATRTNGYTYVVPTPVGSVIATVLPLGRPERPARRPRRTTPDVQMRPLSDPR
ncbi:hypothetical protein [Brevundimonas sp.]|uniref:hypothetical protein n=1 Tax=Brevundimonas sp. TaxID=1871086 RepID=UPI003F719002